MRQVPLVGVIRNPRSHRNTGAPPEWTGRATVLLETPTQRSELQAILARFAERRVDYIVVDGGDGTVRDVLTCGAGIFGESWPPLIVLPNGKTNALAVDLGLPAGWSLADALEAHRRPAASSSAARSSSPSATTPTRGCRASCSAPAPSPRRSASASRRTDAGAFNNAVAVFVTAIWGLLQALFGGDAQRLAPRHADAAVRRRGPRAAAQRHRPRRRALPDLRLDARPASRRASIRSATLKAALRARGDRQLALRPRAARTPIVFRGVVSERCAAAATTCTASTALRLDIGDRFILDGEAFPAGRYQLSLGPKLRFVVP